MQRNPLFTAHLQVGAGCYLAQGHAHTHACDPTQTEADT